MISLHDQMYDIESFTFVSHQNSLIMWDNLYFLNKRIANTVVIKSPREVKTFELKQVYDDPNGNFKCALYKTDTIDTSVMIYSEM